MTFSTGIESGKDVEQPEPVKRSASRVPYVPGQRAVARESQRLALDADVSA